jgi:hypothetical protein
MLTNFYPTKSVSRSGNNFFESKLKQVSSEQEFKVYPNPAKEILYIKLPDVEKNSNYNYEICNSQGQVVLSLQNKVALDKIELNNLSDGIYLLKVLNNSTYKIFTHSFVVKR